MRAVNLIPPEQQRGGGGERSGLGSFALLGGLAVLVVAAAAWALTGNAIDGRKADLARLERETAVAEAKSAALRPYREFAALKQARVQTVASIAGSRFDWSYAMRELARVVPEDVWLTQLVATVTPGVSFEGAGSGTTNGLRGSIAAPAIELTGCTTSHTHVARMMARMRQIDGVTRVSLASSEKGDSASSGSGGSGSSGGGGGGASAGGSDCRNGSTRFPQFQLVMFFEAAAAQVAPQGAAPGAATASPQTTATTGAKP